VALIHLDGLPPGRSQQPEPDPSTGSPGPGRNPCSILDDTFLDRMFGTPSGPNSALYDAWTCTCFGAGLGDVFIPAPFGVPFELLDCLCNLFTFFEDAGTRAYDTWYTACGLVESLVTGGEAPLGDIGLSSIPNTFIDVVAVTNLMVAAGLDCGSIVIEALAALAAGAGGGTAGTPTGPGAILTALIGAGGGVTATSIALDGAVMAVQNTITQGTPIPRGQCAACLRGLAWGFPQSGIDPTWCGTTDRLDGIDDLATAMKAALQTVGIIGE
jgi:hypothetical protein